MRQFLIATIALPLQAGLPCLAETYTVYGVGNTSCGAYVEARSNANDQGIDYGMWLTGYLTVINQYRLSDERAFSRVPMSKARCCGWRTTAEQTRL
jgi:hypothetical protein